MQELVELVERETWRFEIGQWFFQLLAKIWMQQCHARDSFNTLGNESKAMVSWLGEI